MQDTYKLVIKTGNDYAYADGQLSVDGIDYGIRQAVADAQSSATPSDHVLPEVDSESGVPTKVMASANPYTLTLTTDGNTDKLLMVDTNNIPIKAVTYAGGIVGYCEKNSAILIKNCKNAGSITLAEELLAEGSDFQRFMNPCTILMCRRENIIS